MIKKISLYFLAVIVSVVFLSSAYLKLHPIEPFEFSFVDAGVSNWKLAPFFARILIGLEFLIGGLFLFNLWLPKFTYTLCYFTISFFVVYLIIQIILHGNEGNCGCFGQEISVTPVQAIIKNVILLFIVFILQRHHKGIDYGKYSKDMMLIVSTSSFILPFVLNPVSFEYSESYLNRPTEGYRLKLEIVYEHALLNKPPKSLSKGKHVISFLSLTCPHCRIAAKKMRIIHDRHPEISFYFVLNGKEHELKEFFSDTQAEEIPHCRLRGQYFLEVAGLELPAIYLVNNSVVEHSVDFAALNEDAILDWMNNSP